MAAYGWRKNHSVEEALFKESHLFSFFQAVRLLERLAPNRVPVGEDVDPQSEVVRFKSDPKLGFPASEVESLTPSRDEGPPEMKVSFLGLAGAQGPLPRAFTELVLSRARDGNSAPREFLDIFNHRLISLLHRGRKKYRPALDSESPDEGRLAGCLYALTGLGSPGLLGRMAVRDRAFLVYSGLLSGVRRPMVSLGLIVGGYFGVKAKIQPFCGGWHDLGADQQTRIGFFGQNQALGREAVLGRRVWDQEASFEICLGPLTYRQLLEFLPTSRGFSALCALVRFYIGNDLDFSLRMVVAAPEVPPTRLGRAVDTRLGWTTRLDRSGPAELRLGRSSGSRLGWTSWLRTREPATDDRQLTLRGQSE